MFVSALALLGFIILSLPITATSGVYLHARDINQPLLESYDYVVVGCGISGLVVTNRLSELPDRYADDFLKIIDIFDACLHLFCGLPYSPAPLDMLCCRQNRYANFDTQKGLFSVSKPANLTTTNPSFKTLSMLAPTSEASMTGTYPQYLRRSSMAPHVQCLRYFSFCSIICAFAAVYGFQGLMQAHKDPTSSGFAFLN